MCAEKFRLVLMGGRAEGLACADPRARTPIGATGNYFNKFKLLSSLCANSIAVLLFNSKNVSSPGVGDVNPEAIWQVDRYAIKKKLSSCGRFAVNR